MVLLTCAVSQELGFWLARPHVEMLVTGVGPVEAACAVSRALAQGPVDLIVNAGIAGAFADAADVGDSVVVADDFFELGIETGEAIVLPENQRLVDRAASDVTLVDRLAEAGFPVVRGVTVSRVTSTDASAQRLRAFGAGIESMEGFAVLRAAEIAGVPAIQVRGISNIVGDRGASRWDFGAGVRATERIVNALFDLLGYESA